MRAGLLAPAGDIPGRYIIPIPSCAEFLRALPEEPPPQFQTHFETARPIA